MADQSKTVTVEALAAHTYDGESYEVGDTYDIEEQYAESVVLQGKAVRVDRAKVAKAAVKEGEKASKPGKPVAAMRAEAPARATKQARMKRTK